MLNAMTSSIYLNTTMVYTIAGAYLRIHSFKGNAAQQVLKLQVAARIHNQPRKRHAASKSSR